MKEIVISLALACAALPGFASQVRVDFDHGTHFSGYKTYSWAPGDDPAQDVLFPNQLMRERIACSIEEALAAKGLKRVASGGDLLVSYGVAVKEVPQFTTFYDGPGWGWGWAGGFSTTTVQTIYEGTLVLNMVDARRKQLVFEGTSTETISSKPEKNTRKLAKAVNEIFEKYPPQL
jgi:hypothetical protein